VVPTTGPKLVADLAEAECDVAWEALGHPERAKKAAYSDPYLIAASYVTRC